MEEIKIGVLAIQGSFREHAALVKRAHPNATAVEVRKGSQLSGCRGLIVPGGGVDDDGEHRASIRIV